MISKFQVIAILVALHCIFAVSDATSLGITSTTDNVIKDVPFDLTCNVQNFVLGNSTVYEVRFAYSTERVKPAWNNNTGFYTIDQQNVVSFVRQTSFVVDFAEGFTNVSSGKFSVQVNPKTDSAAGIYMCFVQTTENPPLQKYESNLWRSAITYTSDDTALVPTVDLKREISTVANAKNRYAIKCTVNVAPLLNYVVGFVWENDRQVGYYSVNHESQASILWTSSQLVNGINIFPEKITNYPVFTALVQSSHDLEYIKSKLQCAVTVTISSPVAVRAIYYSGAAFSLVLPSTLMLLVIAALTRLSW